MRTHCSHRDVASAEQKKLDPEIMLTIRWWSLIIPRTFWLAMEQIRFKEEICRAMMGCCSKLKGLFYIVILLSSELYGTQNAAGFLPRYVMSEIVIRYLPKCVPFPLNVRVLAHMSHNFIGFFSIYSKTEPSDCWTWTEISPFKQRQFMQAWYVINHQPITLCR